MPDSDTPGRRARKRTQTLDLLAQTAIGLFETHGYEAVTMEQIAAADVAKGTLYNHFPTRESVLAHWIHAQLANDLHRLGPVIARKKTFASAISSLLDASAVCCESHRVYVGPYLRFRFLSFETAASDENDAGAVDMIDAFGRLISKGQHSGELRVDLDASDLAALFHHLYLGALMRWLTVPGLKLRDEFAAAVELFVKGAAVPLPPASRSRKKT
jgi:TetR/AcrR family transcriptional regulator, regulator of autoinduction and epiphytic fitness